MKKYIKNLFLMIVVIGFFVVGKNVKAFDYTSGLYWFYWIGPIDYNTPLYFNNYETWSGTYQQNAFGMTNFQDGRLNRADFILSDQQHYAQYTFQNNTPYKLTIVYAMYPKGSSLYMQDYNWYTNDPTISVKIRSNNVDYEQANVTQFWDVDDTTSPNYYYLVNTIYFDCITTGNLIYITHGANNLVSNYGHYLFVNNTAYSQTVGETSYLGIAWTSVEEFSQTPDVTGIERQQQKTNQELQKNNSFLKEIRDKLNQFKNSFDEKMDNLISKVQNIIQNMSSGVSGIVSNILSFISNNVLGLDDIDDTIQDFVESFDENEAMQDIHDFLYSPVSLFNTLASPAQGARCQNISTTMFNKTIVIPSGCFFWDRQDVQTFRTFWNWLFGGFLIFKFGLEYFKIIHNALDPTKDDLGGLNV